MVLLPAGYRQQVNGKTADVSSELMKNNFDAVTGIFIFKCDWTVHPITESPKIKLCSQKSLISAQINLVLIKSKQPRVLFCMKLFSSAGWTEIDSF